MKTIFNYDVDVHFKDIGWDTYSVHADCIDHAIYTAIQRIIDETYSIYRDNVIDSLRVYKSGTGILLKEYNI